MLNGKLNYESRVGFCNSLPFFLLKNMEFVLFGLVLSTVIIILAIRYFVKQLADKLLSPTKYPQNFKSSKNEVSETDANEVEFNENNPLDIPKDVKFEVEGGDTQTPPGFQEKEKGK